MFDQIPSDAIIHDTIDALKKNGIESILVETGEDAKKEVLKLIPENAEVMQMSSVSLDTIGLSKEINESGNYDAVKPKLMKMDRSTQAKEMQKLGAAPEYSVGSVHAVTHDGKVLIASNTGSQLPGYVYGSNHVIWVVGAQKIVKNTDEGIRRIYDYILPLESVRLNKAYNITTGSFVSKLLIVNREMIPGRIKMILVREKLGF